MSVKAYAFLKRLLRLLKSALVNKAIQAMTAEIIEQQWKSAIHNLVLTTLYVLADGPFYPFAIKF